MENGEWKMKKIIVLLITIVLFVSCSKKELNYTVTEIDGVKVYHNKNIPSDPDFKIAVKEEFVIDGTLVPDSLGKFYDPFYLSVDSANNIYILDKISSSIKKFDSKGNFLTTFGRKGQGPGEMIGPMCLMYHNNKIFVRDSELRKVHLFTREGEYEKSLDAGKEFLRYITAFDGSKYMGFARSYSKDGREITHDLVMYDDNSDLRKEFTKQVLKNDVNDYQLNNFYNAFAISDDEIFVSKYGTNDYEINVYDHNGDFKYRIRKNYREILFTDDEVDAFQKQENVIVKKYGGDPYTVKFKKKKVINNMYVDKNGRLWVVASVDRTDGNSNFVFDVFEKGVFINTVTIEGFLNSRDYLIDDKLFFVNDRIYFLDNANQLVKVYTYD